MNILQLVVHLLNHTLESMRNTAIAIASQWGRLSAVTLGHA